MRTLELLAPAKNLECGIAAIDHGADAVYIGAPRFGARAAVGNSIEDIKQLCDYAHRFGAKVHVTVNTIVYDSELADTLQMIRSLQDAGVDALLLQDMGVFDGLRHDAVWQRQLHASTQCDTRSAEKVKWLQNIGFQRAVLARELSVDEISDIHKAVPGMDLEVFVHGALCVSYSGVCYASEYCFGRSANRGECAQFCRLKFDLIDDKGKTIESQRHLLSLRDMCQIEHLEELADAGACSFKIEGRLKNVAYVKNVVSAYSQRLNELVSRRPQDYCRASLGRVAYGFEPNLKKTFNRGFTNYFLHGRRPDIASFDTPKAIGEYVGKVKEIRGNSFNVASLSSFANGDGLCFVNENRELEGFRVNRAEGNRLFPLKMPHNLRPGMPLYRNNDMEFEKILAGNTAERKIPIKIVLGVKATEENGGLPQHCLSLKAYKCLPKDRDNSLGTGQFLAKVSSSLELGLAKKPQHDNIVRQLGKLGGTPFESQDIYIDGDADQYFVPNSVLTEMRRQLVEVCLATFTSMDKDTCQAKEPLDGKDSCQATVKAWQPEYAKFGYLYNIANRKSRTFYQAHGMAHVENAFELDQHLPQHKDEGKAMPLIMQCRHCIRYSLGACVKRGGHKPTWKEPLHLQLPDGRKFLLEFACRSCQMNVYAEKN